MYVQKLQYLVTKPHVTYNPFFYFILNIIIRTGEVLQVLFSSGEWKPISKQKKASDNPQ